MKEGKISEIGTYDDLMKNKSDFADFLIEQMLTIDSDESEVEESEREELRQTLEENLGANEVKKKLEKEKKKRRKVSVGRTNSIGNLSEASEIQSEVESIYSKSSISLRKRKGISSQVSIPEAKSEAKSYTTKGLETFKSLKCDNVSLF
jgi:hypothetical protein